MGNDAVGMAYRQHILLFIISSVSLFVQPVTRAMMKRYLELERKVQRFEKNQVLQTKLQLKQEQLSSLDGIIQQLEGRHQQCVTTVYVICILYLSLFQEGLIQQLEGRHQQCVATVYVTYSPTTQL